MRPPLFEQEYPSQCTFILVVSLIISQYLRIYAALYLFTLSSLLCFLPNQFPNCCWSPNGEFSFLPHAQAMINLEISTLNTLQFTVMIAMTRKTHVPVLQDLSSNEKIRASFLNILTKRRKRTRKMTTIHGNIMTIAISRMKKILVIYPRTIFLKLLQAKRPKRNLGPLLFVSLVQYASWSQGQSVARPVGIFSVPRALSLPRVRCHLRTMYICLDAFAKCIVNRGLVLSAKRQEI